MPGTGRKQPKNVVLSSKVYFQNAQNPEARAGLKEDDGVDSEPGGGFLLRPQPGPTTTGVEDDGEHAGRRPASQAGPHYGRGTEGPTGIGAERPEWREAKRRKPRASTPWGGEWPTVSRRSPVFRRPLSQRGLYVPFQSTLASGAVKRKPTTLQRILDSPFRIFFSNKAVNHTWEVLLSEIISRLSL